jgi:hypothetical protein
MGTPALDRDGTAFEDVVEHFEMVLTRRSNVVQLRIRRRFRYRDEQETVLWPAKEPKKRRSLAVITT